MAIDFAGMFADPNSFRDQRLQDLMQQRAGISQMGGSMNQLLGQVAAGGGATGAQLAEGIGGMFGLQTREEAQAKQLQDMASQVSMEDPVALGAFAKRLNDMGMTKESLLVLNKRQEVMDRIEKEKERTRDLEDRQRGIAQGKTRTITDTVMRPMSIGSGKNAQVVMVPEQVQYTEVWNEKKQQWERVGGGVSSAVDPSKYVTSEGGGARVPQGTTVAPPKTEFQTKQDAQDATVDPWSQFSRY